VPPVLAPKRPYNLPVPHPSQVNDKQRYKARRVFGRICVAFTIAILLATLWPFNPWPSNDVSWLKEGNGIRFGRNGILRSRSPLRHFIPAQGLPASIEILLQPNTAEGVQTILSFYSVENPRQFQLGQFQDDLMVMSTSRDVQGQLRLAELDADHILRARQIVFLTITSGDSGTSIYLNGTIVQRSSRFHFRGEDLQGELILGTSPLDHLPCSGELLGVSFYATELTPVQVLTHVRMWQNSGAFGFSDSPSPMLLYDFSERSGTLIHSKIVSGPDLEISSHYLIPHKLFLKPFWKELTADSDYVKDVLRNIVGFMPLGVFLFAYFSCSLEPKQSMLAAVICGATLSLSIEILQAYIPGRSSGTTDILTNTLGAFLGAWLGGREISTKVFSRIGLTASEESLRIHKMLPSD